MESLLERGRWHERPTKALAFLARFARDAYFDMECPRLSSLWGKGAAPRWLMEVGGWDRSTYVRTEVAVVEDVSSSSSSQDGLSLRD